MTKADSYGDITGLQRTSCRLAAERVGTDAATMEGFFLAGGKWDCSPGLELEEAIVAAWIDDKASRFGSEFEGQRGSHFELATRLEAAGYVVQLDSDDNERSDVRIRGAVDVRGADIVIGEIRGDSEAEIVSC